MLTRTDMNGDGEDYNGDGESIIRSLCPEDACVATHTGSAEAHFLFPEEEVAVAGALGTRRSEFSIGRTCAREALRRLGAPAGAIPVGADRGPVWPSGVTGTITHTRGLTAAAVAWRSRLRAIGLDAEARARPLSPSLQRFICTPDERRRLPELVFPLETEALRLFFSAKEAVHKCVAPLSGITLNFQDVELDFDLARGRFTARMIGRSDACLPDFQALVGRFAVTDRFVITTAVILESALPAIDRSHVRG